MEIERFISLAGLLVFIGVALLLSDDRRGVSARLILWGVGLQFLLGVIILKTTLGLVVFDMARVVMTKILDFTEYGAVFLFGTLTTDPTVGAFVAFRVLPTIIFVSSLMGVLCYFRVIQTIVRAMGWVMQRTMRVSGAESFAAASFVFMGIEAITGMKQYIQGMTRSELFTLMTCFMATIAGSVMAAYVSFGASAGHLLAASVMSAPAAIVVAKLMVPETGMPQTTGSTVVEYDNEDVNVLEAAANGAQEGLKLALTIGAMLLAFVSLIGALDFMLKGINVSFEMLMGYLFTPVAFIMGVPWEDCYEVGGLLGIKIVFNEFISYQKLQAYIEAGTLAPRSVTIATYALCSFANLGSLAILIGGIGSIAPEHKKEVARMGLRALVAGCMAGFMTATIAGVLI